MRVGDGKHTICWDCKKCTGDCDWSSNFTPVEGWTAIKDNVSGSYTVVSCPEYEEDWRPIGADLLAAALGLRSKEAVAKVPVEKLTEMTRNLGYDLKACDDEGVYNRRTYWLIRLKGGTKKE